MKKDKKGKVMSLFAFGIVIFIVGLILCENSNFIIGGGLTVKGGIISIVTLITFSVLLTIEKLM